MEPYSSDEYFWLRELVLDTIRRLNLEWGIVNLTFLERVRKSFGDNVEKYDMIGSYDFHENCNPFSGVFEIGNGGKLVGEIHDPASTCKVHIVAGLSYMKDHVAGIDFVKIPTIPSLSPIYYNVRKSDGSRGRDGKYEGLWHFNEAFTFKLDLSGPELEKGNKTEISLHKVSYQKVF